jgi:hypothetical protein
MYGVYGLDTQKCKKLSDPDKNDIFTWSFTVKNAVYLERDA